MLRNLTDFYIENFWHNFKLDWTEWGGWMLLFGVTCAWGRATHCLMTTYVTVFPYRYKLTLTLSTVHVKRSLWKRLRPHTQSMLNCFRAVLVDLMQAAGGWRSCAEGVPAGQSAASASSVLSSEDDREDRSLKIIPPVPLLARASSSSVHAGTFSALQSSLIHSFTPLYRN